MLLYYADDTVILRLDKSLNYDDSYKESNFCLTSIKKMVW
jgi:hypothetical protein